MNSWLEEGDMIEILESYQCERFEIVNTEGQKDYQFTGGSLASSIEKKGLKALISLLEFNEEIRAIDQGNQIVLRREGMNIRISYRWDDDSQYEQVLPFELPMKEALERSPDVEDIKVLNVGAELPKAENPQCVEEQSAVKEAEYQSLGRAFCERFGVVAPYVAGAMAGGIASVDLVRAMSRAGMLAFFGSGGLPLEQVERALKALSQEKNIWGCNLLHNPHEPSVEKKTIELLLQYGVKVVSASAFIELTKELIHYRYSGISMKDGKIHCPNQIIAKLSHPSIAERFLSPPPPNLLLELMKEGIFTEEQAQWAKKVPVASALMIEGDSGGHTDTRPLSVIFPTILRLRNSLMDAHQFQEKILLGAAGGLGEPLAMKAAFAMDADFVVVGSVHQSTIEAGTSLRVKKLLATADITDCSKGIAPDMFEQGATVQVLSKKTFYASRSKKLYNMYRQYTGVSAIPKIDIERIERQIFKASLQDIWNEVQKYWQARDPRQLKRAKSEPKHQMALIFRWYLGNASRWAREGKPSRVKDYQIWCGPAMGAFNTWAKGTEFELAENRSIVAIAFALLDEVL